MKKVTALLLVLFCSIIATPLVSSNPVGPYQPHTSPYTAGYIAMAFSIIALLDLMIYIIRKKKLISNVSRYISKH